MKKNTSAAARKILVGNLFVITCELPMRLIKTPSCALCVAKSLTVILGVMTTLRGTHTDHYFHAHCCAAAPNLF